MMTSKNKFSSIVTQTLENPERFFCCDYAHWPVCIFDFTFKSILPEYFVYRTRPGVGYTVIDDYFITGKPLNHPE